MRLFFVKWQNEIEFLQYMKHEWIEHNPNWFEGAAQRMPSTNNALEATNNVLKKEYLLPLGQFIDLLDHIVQSMSERYGSDMHFANSPEVTLKDWTDGYQYCKTFAKTKIQKRRLRQRRGIKQAMPIGVILTNSSKSISRSGRYFFLFYC